MITRVDIPLPLDMHVHFRQDAMLKTVAPYTARHFSRALVMPNTKPAVLTPERLQEYRQAVVEATSDCPNFTPLMTFEIREDTRVVDIEQFKGVGALAGKVYPRGLTTNAEQGVLDYASLSSVLAEMERCNLVLCLHGEQPDDVLTKVEGLDREVAFLERTLPFIATQFPNLRIVMEHITSRKAVEAVLKWPNVAATITVHHLLLKHDDVGGDRMCPAHYCKPVAKRVEDREALLRAATWGHPKFFFGSDSAPHHRSSKEAMYDCCAGIFTAPVALPLLVQIFDQRGAVSRLRSFVYDAAVNFYGLPRSTQILRLVKDEWTVPEEIDGIVPFKAGEMLPWSVVSSKQAAGRYKLGADRQWEKV